MSERVTQLTVASHRRFVLETTIYALRAAFNASYNRDPQLVNLRVSADHPLKQIDYPTIVVEYENQNVTNAGVGHEEWFIDEYNQIHKWHHSRFEGQMNFEIYGLTPYDRDLLADALTEVIRFGRLDDQLIQFFYTLYGDPSAPVGLIFNQIALNADEVASSGNNASPAPWQPEDQLVYGTALTTEVFGGYYNIDPSDLVKYVTSISLHPYNSSPFDQPVVIDLTRNWSNPFAWQDAGVVTSKSVVTGAG